MATNALKIQTGLIRIPVERDGMDVGELAFNPGDNLFAEKFYDLMAEFRQKQIEFERKAKALDQDAQSDEYGIPTNLSDGLKFRREVCEYFREKIDHLFGQGTSQIVFGDALEPELISQFFEAITPIFQQARDEKVKKYLNQEHAGRVME